MQWLKYKLRKFIKDLPCMQRSRRFCVSLWKETGVPGENLPVWSGNGKHVYAGDRIQAIGVREREARALTSVPGNFKLQAKVE